MANRNDPSSSLAESTWIQGRIDPAQQAASDIAVALADSKIAADSFPGYEILREVHRGGQGIVYQAIQKATKRKVAIKVMREGPFADTRERARFEREVQILGSLHHPSIVAIHDSGLAAGMSYYVMDYTSGRPLDAYVAEGERSIEELLRLFAKICEAVNAAHLRGVIHRDLKPGNILVDASGEPRVLDFGLAKVAWMGMTAETKPAVMTMTGQFVGSLPWASPEQAEGIPGLIDTRTDVYALGVILYQMLTRQFPYEVIGTMRDVLDNILKAEPVRPSTIRKQINDEVETIVLKCLQKERQRRYQSAGELARDVQRYLDGEPIEAKRDSVWYLLKKTVRRYRLAAAVLAGYLVVVTGGSVGLLLLYQRAERARVETAGARDEAARAAQRAQAVVASLDRVVSSATDWFKRTQPEVVQRFLQEAAQTAITENAGNEEAIAAVSFAIAKNLAKLGTVDEAEQHLQNALRLQRRIPGTEPELIAELLKWLGNIKAAQGDSKEAARHYTEALRIYQSIKGQESAETAELSGWLATMGQDKSPANRIDGLNHAIVMRRELVGSDDQTVALLLSRRGLIYRDLSDWDRAKADLLESRDILQRTGGGGTKLGDVLQNLALLYQDLGDLDQAESLYRQGLAIYRSIVSEDHPAYLTVAVNFAMLLKSKGKLDEAELLVRSALEVFRRNPNANKPRITHAIPFLASILRAQGKIVDAKALCQEGIEMGRGSNSGDLATALLVLGQILMNEGDAQAAERAFRECVEIRKKKGTENNLDLHIAESNLGASLIAQHRLAEAEPLVLAGYNGARTLTGPASQFVKDAAVPVAQLYHALNRTEEAAKYEIPQPLGSNTLP